MINLQQSQNFSKDILLPHINDFLSDDLRNCVNDYLIFGIPDLVPTCITMAVKSIAKLLLRNIFIKYVILDMLVLRRILSSNYFDTHIC